MHKLVVFGSARIDAFLELPPNLAPESCSLDTKKCVIELSYAAKVPVNKVSFLVGGNGANVAVGAKRLGVDSTLVAELGQGPLADFAKRELEKEIGMEYVTQSGGVKQGFGAVIVYHGERTILSYYSPERPPFPQELPPCPWAYLTSVGDLFEDFYEDVLVWLSKNGTKVAFNPGGRQIRKGKEWLGRYLGKTEIILVNREEAEDIIGAGQTHGREKDLLDEVCALGPKIAIVTDGGNGAFAKADDKYYHVGIMPIDAMERTGAGDAFSAGCVSALIGGKSLPESLVWGTVNSASVIGYVGPQDGLLREDRLREWLETARESGVVVDEI